MLKVDLKNVNINNVLTGYNELECIVVDGNDLFIADKLEPLTQYFKDEIKAKALTLDLKIIRKEIEKKRKDFRYSNFDDMSTTNAFREKTAVLEAQEKEYIRQLEECEKVSTVPAYSGIKVDVVLGNMKDEKQSILEECVEVPINKVRLLVDILALDDAKLARDSAWFKAHGMDVTIETTPGVPLAISGGKTVEELLGILLQE